DLGISVYIGPAHCYRRVLAVGICNHGSGDGYLPVGMVSPSIRCTRARTDPGILAYYSCRRAIRASDGLSAVYLFGDAGSICAWLTSARCRSRRLPEWTRRCDSCSADHDVSVCRIYLQRLINDPAYWIRAHVRSADGCFPGASGTHSIVDASTR